MRCDRLCRILQGQVEKRPASVELVRAIEALKHSFVFRRAGGGNDLFG